MKQIWISFIIFLLFHLSFGETHCPDGSAISPCECYDDTNSVRVFCEFLELSHLTTILRESFCGLTIGQFYLNKPNITYLPSNLFFKNTVQDIRIENANISHFTQAGRSAFFGQEASLELLSMRRCNLAKDLKWRMIADLRALHYLDLSFNNLKTIPKEWFHLPPPNLRSLILKGNHLTQLEPGLFHFLHTLNELDLSSNSIEYISRDMFPDPGNELTFLRLSDNNLSFLPEGLFVEMFGLRRLYLDNNKLSSLGENVWKPIWGNLERLELYGNPIDCDCDLLWITKFKLPQMLYGKCNSLNIENKLKGNTTEIIDLRKLEDENFKCIS